MTPEQKLELIEQLLVDSYHGSSEFPFHVIRQSVTKSIIEAIQEHTGDQNFGIPFHRI